MPITSKQRAVAAARAKRRQKAQTTGTDSSDQSSAATQPRPPERERYAKGDCFERDTLFTIPHATAENDLYDAVEPVEATGTDEEPNADAEAKKAEELAERNRIIAKRMQELEEALPPNVRQIDNLSAPGRPGELETKPQKRFRGSLVDYAFKLVKEAERADAYTMRVERQQDWNAWHERMYTRHEAFSMTHYKLFRRLIERPMDEGIFKTLLMWRMVERGKITAAECDKLVSEYHAIQEQYPDIRRYIEEQRERADRRSNGEALADSDGDDDP